jgi:hypothetical protein
MRREGRVIQMQELALAYQEICSSSIQMKTLIQIHKEGKYFAAIDLITNVADQGLTESEAISNLKKDFWSTTRFF